jgi:hypothetical protein
MVLWLGFTALGLTLGRSISVSLARALSPGVTLSPPWRAAAR